MEQVFCAPEAPQDSHCNGVFTQCAIAQHPRHCIIRASAQGWPSANSRWPAAVPPPPPPLLLLPPPAPALALLSAEGACWPPTVRPGHRQTTLTAPASRQRRRVTAIDALLASTLSTSKTRLPLERAGRVLLDLFFRSPRCGCHDLIKDGDAGVVHQQQ